MIYCIMHIDIIKLIENVRTMRVKVNQNHKN